MRTEKEKKMQQTIIETDNLPGCICVREKQFCLCKAQIIYNKGYANAQKEILEKIEWIKKECSKLPTDRSASHLQSQIVSFIIPEAIDSIRNVNADKSEDVPK